MTARIAIPEPTSDDIAYNQRTLPLYLAALQSSDAIPVVIPLHERQDRVARILQGVQGVLLPGSGYDVDPQKYGEARIPECAKADGARAAVDELLLQDAFNLRKPILGICYGAQALNVWRNGTLIQHMQTPVDHAPGRTVLDAHPVRVTSGSRLAAILQGKADFPAPTLTDVNSSHHQAIRLPGDHLAIAAISSRDEVIEAIELDEPDHFVVGVQWHPERTYTHSRFSRSIFTAFVEAAAVWQMPKIDATLIASR